MHKTFVFTFLLACLFPLTAISSGDVNNQNQEQSLKDSILSNPESAVAGGKRFNSLCAYCHGSEGSGGKAKKLQGRDFEVDYLFNTITNGKKRGSLNMPPWKNLAEKKRWELVAYILTLKDK